MKRIFSMNNKMPLAVILLFIRKVKSHEPKSDA